MGWFGVEVPVVSDTVHSTVISVEFKLPREESSDVLEWEAKVRVWWEEIQEWRAVV